MILMNQKIIEVVILKDNKKHHFLCCINIKRISRKLNLIRYLKVIKFKEEKYLDIWIEKYLDNHTNLQ